MSYVHAGDKAIAELVRMVDGGVEQEVARHVVDDLVHFDQPGAIFGRMYRDRSDFGIKCKKLTCPVGAHFILSMDVAAFQTVRPDHIRLHLGDYGLDVTGIEIAIGSAKNLVLGCPWLRHAELSI